MICECSTNEVLLVGHFDIEAICHRKDWSWGDLASGSSVLDQFGLLSASLLQICFVFASSTIEIKAREKKIVVKQGMTTSVDKEISGIAKSCETTFQDLIKVALDGDIA